jgi:hypothetical protein
MSSAKGLVKFRRFQLRSRTNPSQQERPCLGAESPFHIPVIYSASEVSNYDYRALHMITVENGANFLNPTAFSVVGLQNLLVLVRFEPLVPVCITNRD